MTAPRRLFTTDELKTLSTDLTDLALEAIEKGDKEKAKDYCKKQKEMAGLVHGLYVQWVPGILSYVHERWGETAVIDLVKASARGYTEDFVEASRAIIQEKELRGYVEFLAGAWQGHIGGALKIEEDDEKFIFIHQPCGSGGFLVNENAYDGPGAFTRIKSTGQHTWGKENMPVYCTHCPWVHEIFPVELHGKGAQLWIHATPFPEKSGDPCVHYIYKDPNNIPEQYQKRAEPESKDA